MTTITDPPVAPVLPLRPSREAPPDAEAHRAPARPPAPAREPEPAKEAKPRRVAPAVLRLRLAFSGASVMTAAPPSLAVIWARHVTAGRAWDGVLLRWPRWGYGVLHVCLVAPLAYLLVLATDSPPKAAAYIAVIALLLWLFFGLKVI